MTINKAQVQKNFGQNAVTYDQYAVVQKEMAKELFDKIKKTGCYFQNILEIGCGTGFLTELLAREYPNARIIATDIAPEMILIASNKLATYSNIKYFVADGENLSIDDKVPFGRLPFDLIVSNVVFQWFTEYVAAFTQYHSYLEPGGYLIFSTLGVGTFKELYVCLKDAQKGNPTHKLANSRTIKKREPFIEKKYLQKIMINIGFKDMGIEEITKQEYFDSCRDFLRALKMIGAHNYLTEELAVKGLGSGIFSLIKRYDKMFCDEMGVPTTYQCLYCWGRRIT